ncbi:ABC transporter substrate-binding protein [Acinetobacter sp. NIPH 2699]|uniref:ABC transporter substrate-binding protein n=1 Tax=Acinetobacter sp. NIPH 2699 TaxID=2923433 RepID=UPI001F4A8AB5|nr:ABC transporter substrate-binding protein [Acinetobacter sp. NIPH 2699]MCH7336277.1 ABC transporter substrate-binding protein [Acinetobacter sp. NIPH 2699]
MNMQYKHASNILKLIQSSILICVSVFLFACSKQDPNPAQGELNVVGKPLETLSFNYMGAAGVVGPIALAEDLGYLAPVKPNYVGIATGGPQGLQAALTGDVDISSSSFVGSIVNVVAGKAPMVAVVAAYGSPPDDNKGYYVLENSSIKQPRDLIGKKVAVNILGAQAEVMLKEWLKRGGLTADEIKQVTLVVVPPGSGEQALRQGHVQVAALTGPAIERGNVRVLYRDWEMFGDKTLGAYAMSKRYLDKNPNTATHIVTAIGRAFEWANAHPREEVIARFEKIIEKRQRMENSDALKYFYGWGVADGGKLKEEDFKLWIDWLEKDGQLKPEQIKADQVYTNQYNAYDQIKK